MCSYWLGRRLLLRIHETIGERSRISHNADRVRASHHYLQQLQTLDASWDRLPLTVKEQPTEDFYVPGHGGVNLHCVVYLQPHRAGQWIVLLHDWTQNTLQVWPYVNLYWQQGFNVLTYDAREHGLSAGEDRFFTFGHLEKFDLVKMIQWLARRFKPQSVVLHGRGVGATTIMVALKCLSPSLNVMVRALILENGWLSPLAALSLWPRSQGGRRRPICYKHGLKWAIKRHDRYRITTICPREDVNQYLNEKRVLVLHDRHHQLAPWAKTAQFWHQQQQLRSAAQISCHALRYDWTQQAPLDFNSYQSKIFAFLTVK